MNKAQLGERLLEEGLTYHDMKVSEAHAIIDFVFETIADQLEKGNEVSIAKFGIFGAKKRAARMGRNPKTGEPVQIGSRVRPKFRPSEAFKRRVN